MKKFSIFVSKQNVYTGQVEKIKRDSKMLTEIIYIEDYIKKPYNFNIDENVIVYFLCCNSLIVPNAIKLLAPMNCNILNKNYLLNNLKKKDVQIILENNNVLIPQIISPKKLDELKFPIFCKENMHEGIIFQTYNKITLEKFFNKFNEENFYLEEAITEPNEVIKEIKLYYVDGKIFGKNEKTIIDGEMIDICTRISKSLDNLEVFSVDIVQSSKGNNYVIDVNPAAGFYLSDSGRNYFLEYVTSVIGRR